MPRTAVRMVVLVAIGILVVFVIFMVNQVAQLVALADRISPVLGTLTLWCVSAVLLLSFLLPVYWYVRLPRALLPPPEGDAEAVDRYVARLQRRLAVHPRFREQPPRTREEVEAALRSLGEEADRIIRSTALQVFLTTAVSQNGALDAVGVVSAQARMIHRIAGLYQQRPGVRQLLFLYTNVGAAAIVAGRIDDVDLAEYLQPLMATLLGSGLSFSVGGGFSHVLLNSALTGSANAYFTLRVGLLAKRYCGSLSVPERSVLRRWAALEAAQMLPGVAGDGVKGLLKIAATLVTKPVAEAAKGVKETAAGLWTRIRSRRARAKGVHLPEDA